MNSKNKKKIIESINDGFSLTIDKSGSFYFADDDSVYGFDLITISSFSCNDLKEIFKTIFEYIEKHPSEFNLDELVHENYRDGSSRPWWSPITVPGINNGIIAPGSKVGQTRLIRHKSGNIFHPGGLTQKQYQAIKTRLPNTCWVWGCSNNYLYRNRTKVINKRCEYHIQQGARISANHLSLDEVFEEIRIGSNPHQPNSTIFEGDISLIINDISKDRNYGYITITPNSPLTIGDVLIEKILISGVDVSKFRRKYFRDYIGRTLKIVGLRFKNSDCDYSSRSLILHFSPDSPDGVGSNYHNLHDINNKSFFTQNDYIQYNTRLNYREENLLYKIRDVCEELKKLNFDVNKFWLSKVKSNLISSSLLARYSTMIKENSLDVPSIKQRNQEILRELERLCEMLEKQLEKISNQTGDVPSLNDLLENKLKSVKNSQQKKTADTNNDKDDGFSTKKIFIGGAFVLVFIVIISLIIKSIQKIKVKRNKKFY